MADFKILCKNKSGDSRAYFLFVEAPVLASGAKVFQNVYIAAAPVPSNNGTAQFAISKAYFAVCGTSPGMKLGSGVSVITGDWGIAKICQGDKKGSSFTMTGHPGNAAAFDPKRLKQECNKPGNFSIESTEFQLGNGANQFIGLGAQDPSDPTNIVPIASIVADPGSTSYIEPKNKYYISWGTFTAGEIIDVTTIANPCLVDFTGKAATLAKVEHNLDGTWAVTYN